MKQVLVIRDKEHRAEIFGKLQNSIIFKLLETKEIDLLDPYKLGPDIADEVMGWIDGLSGNLLAEVKVDSLQAVCQAMAAILDGVGDRDAAELKKHPVHVLILACTDEGSASDEGSEGK